MTPQIVFFVVYLYYSSVLVLQRSWTVHYTICSSLVSSESLLKNGRLKLDGMMMSLWLLGFQTKCCDSKADDKDHRKTRTINNKCLVKIKQQKITLIRGNNPKLTELERLNVPNFL